MAGSANRRTDETTKLGGNRMSVKCHSANTPPCSLFNGVNLSLLLFAVVSPRHVRMQQRRICAAMAVQVRLLSHGRVERDSRSTRDAASADEQRVAAAPTLYFQMGVILFAPRETCPPRRQPPAVIMLGEATAPGGSTVARRLTAGRKTAGLVSTSRVVKKSGSPHQWAALLTRDPLTGSLARLQHYFRDS